MFRLHERRFPVPVPLQWVLHFKQALCNDISEDTGNDDADYRDRHNATGLFTDTHTDGRGNGLWQEGNIVDMLHTKQRTQ